MNQLQHAPLIIHLGWTLIHFLWQGALVGLVYAGLCRIVGRTSPQLRYGLALITLLTLALLPVLTFFYLSGQQAGTPSVMAPVFPLVSAVHLQGSLHVAASQMPVTTGLALTAWVVAIWLTGVTLLTLRALWAWHLTAGLRSHLTALSAHPWQPLLQSLLAKMHIHRSVQLLASAAARTPMVVGWFKPLILIPPSAVCGLSWQQAEMILAHELAHIRRHDYLINLLQVALETLLFYHPVVHWVSRDARNQREFCCDDAAVEICGDRVAYLKALAELEDTRLQASLNPAANGGSLLQRAYRIAHPAIPLQRPPSWAAVLLGLATALAATGLLHTPATSHFKQIPAVIPAHLIQHPSLAAGFEQHRQAASISPSIELSPTRLLTIREAGLPQLQMVRVIPEPQLPVSPLRPALLQPVMQRQATPPTRLDIIATRRLPQPAYPYLPWRERLGGAVQTTFRINASGRVEDISTEILSGPATLAGAVRMAVTTWRFKPVQFMNKTIAPRLRMIFTFKADDGTKPKGTCVTLTGSHLCSWYRVAIQGFYLTRPDSDHNPETGFASQVKPGKEKVAILLANAAPKTSVFCQPGADGCPALVDTEAHRQQIEQVLNQLGAGNFSGSY